MEQGRNEDDGVLVLLPLPDDPLFVDAVDEAVAGDAGEMPGAQPTRRVGASSSDFASLYIRHRSSFALHARRFLNDPRDVDEVLQEAFLRLFLAMPELETELQALAYCRRTVTNLCIDRYRADQRRPRLVDLETIEWDPSDAESYDDPVLRAEDAAIVREALSLLSPLHREALIKREVEEKPLPQIAAELGIPEESVKHLLYRARRALRRLLVGTSVEPGVDLSATQALRLANERLARATLRSANVLIVLFVAAVTVVGALRVGLQDQREGNGAVGPGVSPALGPGGNPGDSPRLAVPRQSTKRSATRSRNTTPAAPAVPAVGSTQHVTTTATAPAHQPRKDTFTSHSVTTPPTHSTPQGPSSLPTGPARGTFAINAPVIGAVGTASLETNTVELKPTGDWSNTSTFSAPTSTSGTFALQQVVQRSTAGVVSANVSSQLPNTDPTQTQLYSSNVSTSPTVDGNVLVNVQLLVLNPTVASAPVDNSTALSINVNAVYTPDVTQVLAETVSVVEGSAPCCVSPATTTPHDTAGDGTSVPPSPDAAAVGSAAVSATSRNPRDDQSTIASS